MAREFEIRREVVLPASPEAVFEAVTTGTAAWLFPEEGDATTGPTAPGVLAWEPGRRYAVREEGEDGWFNALEFLIEGREGGTAVLRYVHSGVFTDDWDTQYDATGKHTDFYLHTLGQYLRHFPGRPATYLDLASPEAAADPGAFEVLLRELGLKEDAAAGQRLRLEIPGLPAKEAEVDYRTPYFLGLRTDDGLYRFFGRNAFGWRVGVSMHLFADDVDAEATRRAWQSWFDGVYAPAGR
ncbi:SRPBCC family protein [Allostreptomyces psammosilenae]|uniref:SRPBCC domain-containing protein n=1 Tax=Allostreptomyces psammosilenae TaxID=1892865 RepID=A0A852ZLU8_9ACTN|nr:SRPBCC domain-containing protein [Allostreptomyces psammosilenae]NYI03373.1 hypothetical protein [Allostreptomyces psammosilenae]